MAPLRALRWLIWRRCRPLGVVRTSAHLPETAINGVSSAINGVSVIDFSMQQADDARTFGIHNSSLGEPPSPWMTKKPSSTESARLKLNSKAEKPTNQTPTTPGARGSNQHPLTRARTNHYPRHGTFLLWPEEDIAGLG